MPQFAAVRSLLTLLSEVDFGGDAAACSAASRPAADELAEFSVGLRLKQQLLARRAERLARFLRLQLPAGSPGGTPRGGSSGGRSPARGATPCGPGSRAACHGLPERGSSAVRRGLSPSGRGKAQWSPVSIVDGTVLASDTCSTPGSACSIGSIGSTASSSGSCPAACAALSPVPCALATASGSSSGNGAEASSGPAAATGPKPAPPAPPLPPPLGVLRLGVRVMPPTQLNVLSPAITPRARLVSPSKPPAAQQPGTALRAAAAAGAAAAATAAAAPAPPPPPLPRPAGSGLTTAAAAPPPPPPPPPPKRPGAAGRAPPPPPPPPPPAGRPGVPRLAVPAPADAAAGGSRAGTPPPPPLPSQSGQLPSHLVAPLPPEGVERRPIHFDAVKARNAAGSVWEQPPEDAPPAEEEKAPVQQVAAAIRVDALDRLFAKQLPGTASGSPAGSPQRPTAPPAAPVADDDASSVCSSPRSVRGSLALGQRRPIVRIFTGGRKAVNIEILLRKLGSASQVAQAIAELDTTRLPPDVLRELQANLPDASELEALHAYLDSGGDASQLGKAEQLFVALRGTARLQQRLQVLSFMGSLPEAAGEVAQPLGRIAEALDQLRASGQLRLLLHTALRLGNALNAGRKAPQRGIRLASLRKLADTRSMDGSTTLVHYLAALMLDSAPGVLVLGKPGGQCNAVPTARHWTFAELDKQLAAINSGISLVRREQEAAACSGERRQLGALAGQAGALVQRAQLMLAAAKDKAAATLKFLGEDVPAEPALSQVEPKRMLTDLSDFFALLWRAHADGERMSVCLATLQQQEGSAATTADSDEAHPSGEGEGQLSEGQLPAAQA